MNTSQLRPATVARRLRAPDWRTHRIKPDAFVYEGPFAMLPRLADRHSTINDMLHQAAELHALGRLDTEITQPVAPCPEVLEFTDWAYRTRSGILAYAHDHHTGAFPDQLDAFDRDTQPRVSTRAAFESMSALHRPAPPSVEEYWAQVVDQQRPLTCTPAGDPEARAFAALHFNQQGLSTSASHVQVFSGGIQGLLLAFLSAVLTRRISPSGNDLVLAPIGYERSWHPFSFLHDGSTILLDDLTETDLAEWLHEWAIGGGDGTPVLYVPLVNRLTGHVLTRQRAHSLARLVLHHNRDHPEWPAFVFADDSAIDSYHSSQIADDAQPIGAVTGTDLGDSTLGRMSDWTLTATTPGDTFAIPNTHTTFATTHNPWLRDTIQRWSTFYAHTSTTPLDELIAAAALSLTPLQWIEHTNEQVAANLATLRHELARINHNMGFDAITPSPQTTGGRHTALYLHPQLFPAPKPTSTTMFTLLYGGNHNTEATSLLPTAPFDWRLDPEDPTPRPTLRADLAISPEHLTQFIGQLEELTIALHATAST